ncbi:hypothetical protein BgiMline_008200 [Biomphalaria glabrata]|uniref:Uncharacterized protein LOC106079430 isoform X1 n=1 Tax=Biomphalaria glabrata TaxID=6526 RepID=A0A2C9KSN9_BIOGL|nr:uncharacterized protein LOC106079430 isoform X1 [Biomphalaria glabrata]XP_055880649.1 uncharacterized protein LOC106079430 isoform X1 [Biomphalaria glabrata]KAI8747066.1 hypothetical protein BgiMline_018784 [Biomphalaria glabrata]KAI8788734.1 hypothetical protein BgiBS90_011402 [Biomphalaria glabrata]
MDKVFSWFNVKHTKADQEIEQKQIDNEPGENVSQVYPSDPKVDEFFKDFPSPYREKVVQYYSKREGLLQFDFYRKIAMQNEKSLAARGVFLEDQRQLRKSQREEEEKEEVVEVVSERIISDWEKKLMVYIPLQQGDTVTSKLLETVNLSLIGITLMWTALSSRKKYSSPVFCTMVLIGSCGFISSNILAVQRFLDMGVFDKRTDKRSMIDKSLDEVKDVAQIVQNYLLDVSAESKRK